MTKQRDPSGNEIVIPYGNANAALHIRLEGDYLTFCGRNCKHWTYDMDGSYCQHPKAMQESWAGLSENAMSRQRLCFHGNDYEQPTDDLFEPR